MDALLASVDDGVHPFFSPCRNELLVIPVFFINDDDLIELGFVSDLELKFGELVDMRPFFSRSGVLPECRLFSIFPNKTAFLDGVEIATAPS